MLNHWLVSEPTDLLTAAEVAAKLRVSVQSVYRWADSGELTAIRVGGVVRFRRDEIDARLATPDPLDAA